MRADDNIDLTVLDAILDLGQLLCSHQPRSLRDLHGKTLEAFDEGPVVLPGKQRRRHDDGNL